MDEAADGVGTDDAWSGLCAGAGEMRVDWGCRARKERSLARERRCAGTAHAPRMPCSTVRRAVWRATQTTSNAAMRTKAACGALAPILNPLYQPKKDQYNSNGIEHDFLSCLLLLASRENGGSARKRPGATHSAPDRGSRNRVTACRTLRSRHGDRPAGRRSVPWFSGYPCIHRASSPGPLRRRPQCRSCPLQFPPIPPDTP
jgi:hypothetical protein